MSTFPPARRAPWFAAMALAIAAAAASAQTPRTPAPPDARVYFVEPKDGAVVKGPVKVVMGLSGMGVAPAGTDVAKTGHHHVLIDVDKPVLDAPLPADDRHRHFGGGQTETTLTLPPGRHTLQLVLGDKNHIPHDPPIVSQKITITVQP